MVSKRLVCSLSTSVFHNYKPCPCKHFISFAATLTIGCPLFFFRSVSSFIILQLNFLSYHYPTRCLFTIYLKRTQVLSLHLESIPWTNFFSVVLLKNLQGIPIFAVATCLALYASSLISSVGTISTPWATQEYTSASMDTKRTARPSLRSLPHISSPSCHSWTLRILPSRDFLRLTAPTN